MDWHPCEGMPLGSFKKTGKPLLLGSTKFDDRGLVVCTAYDGTQGNDQYIQRFMALRARHARVGHFAQRGL